MFEPVQIYGILHSEDGVSKLTSCHSAICHIIIFAQPESLDESWNDLFYNTPTTHLWNAECMNLIITMIITHAICY